VVACGPKPDSDVIFLMPGNVMTSTSSTKAAYMDIIQQFNQEVLGPKAKIKVKPVWETGDAIQRRYASEEALPDLYVSYADNVSRFAFDSDYREYVRDMEASVLDGTDQSAQAFRDQF